MLLKTPSASLQTPFLWRKEPCIIVGFGLYAVSLSVVCSLLKSDKLQSSTVSIWVFYFALRAGALSNIDGDAVGEQPARGRSALTAHDDTDTLSDWRHETSGEGSQSQGRK